MKYTHLLIEYLLNGYQQQLGRQAIAYKNHVCRVYANCRLLDTNPENAEKYAVAAIFHDIGIWTCNTIDYLPPSIEAATNYLTANGKPDWIEEIGQMIYWHHKTSVYTGSYAFTVENFRKADAIDVSLGLLSFDIPKKEASAIRKALPNKGFHLFLLGRILKNWVRHPLHPLPMFKS